jgi:precorrin-6A/cobalt-precorrin-6A reductase
LILLLDGTSDSRNLAIGLLDAGYSIMATATTDEGIEKLESHNIKTIKGKMNAQLLIEKCRELSINAIIDGSHPYAYSMHENAIKASKELGIPLIRFERNKTGISDNSITYVDSYEKASETAMESGKNILITTGTNNADLYKNLIVERNAFFRVLPDPESISKLIGMGIKKNHIIAMEGTFDENLNRALMEYYRIDTLISKDSGFNTEPKIRAALSIEVKVILISRKEFPVPYTCRSLIEIKKILNDCRIK